MTTLEVWSGLCNAIEQGWGEHVTVEQLYGEQVQRWASDRSGQLPHVFAVEVTHAAHL